MWLQDIAKAIEDLRKVCPEYVITNITPAVNGLRFYTSHFTWVYWQQDGTISEHYENGKIEKLK